MEAEEDRANEKDKIYRCKPEVKGPVIYSVYRNQHTQSLEDDVVMTENQNTLEVEETGWQPPPSPVTNVSDSVEATEFNWKGSVWNQRYDLPFHQLDAMSNDAQKEIEEVQNMLPLIIQPSGYCVPFCNMHREE